MKHLKFLMLVCTAGLLLWTCHGLGGSSQRSFIPGTYVNYAEGEYSVAYDTLLIQTMDEKTDRYRIDRNTAFRRITDGKLMKMEYRHERWMVVYDQKTGSLLDSQKGKVISLYPDSGLLVVGTREYRKVEKE